MMQVCVLPEAHGYRSVWSGTVLLLLKCTNRTDSLFPRTALFVLFLRKTYPTRFTVMLSSNLKEFDTLKERKST